jgi:hypothetical protein
MRRSVAALVVVTMMSGCSTKAGALTGLTLGSLGVMAGAVVYASPSPTPSGAPANLDHWSGGALIFVGGFVMIVSALSLAVVLRTPTTQSRPNPERDQAFAWTRTAARAARLGDCATAIEIEHRIRDLDANVHDAWFVRAPAIKKCLDAVVPAQPAPVEQPAGSP